MEIVGLRALITTMETKRRQAQPPCNLRMTAHKTERQLYWLFFDSCNRAARPVILFPGVVDFSFTYAEESLY